MSAEQASTPGADSILIIIVNYRTAELAAGCLKSLADEVSALKAARVVVVDNDSGDGSAERLRTLIKNKRWESWASIIAASRNGGFATGNNLVIREALASENPPCYFWLLNPDSRIYSGAGRALLDFAKRRPQAGVIGSALSDDEGSWPYAFRFPSLLGEIEAGLRLGLASRALDRWKVLREMTREPAEVDWVPGASMFIRRAVFEEIGLLDEGFFLYFEETDFCLRARRAGWACWYAPDSRVYHKRGQSTGVTKAGSTERLPTYWFDSRRRYFVKNKGLLYALAADFAWVSALSLWRLRRFIQRKPDTDPEGLLGDAILQSAFFKGWSAARRRVGE